MRLLLDTHVFIWLDTAPERLSPAALMACQDPENSLLLSVASAWEMEIKQRIGKLRLDVPLESMVEVQQTINQLQLLSIELQHVLAIRELPPHHGDPFDRLLLAQARFEGARLVTADGQLSRYADQVNLLW